MVHPGDQVGLAYSRLYVWVQEASGKGQGVVDGVGDPSVQGMESVQDLGVHRAYDDRGDWDPEGG